MNKFICAATMAVVLAVSSAAEAQGPIRRFFGLGPRPIRLDGYYSQRELRRLWWLQSYGPSWTAPATDLNTLLFLQGMRSRGSLTLADLVALQGLQAPTVSSYSLADLVAYLQLLEGQGELSSLLQGSSSFSYGSTMPMIVDVPITVRSEVPWTVNVQLCPDQPPPEPCPVEPPAPAPAQQKATSFQKASLAAFWR